MTLSIGDTLPEAELLKIGPDGPTSVDLGPLVKGRKVVLFGLPGAYTGVCTEAHVPSFMRTAEAFRAKGVDEIICVAVNDPFVVDAWAKSTGGAEAGITFLADSASELTKAIGMNFTAPPVGFYDRSKRFALYAEDAVVKALNEEASPGECEISAGETLLAQV